MESKNEISIYLENISIIVLGVLFFGMPLLFTTITTDAFTLPKQIFLIVVVLLLMLFSGARMIAEGNVRIRKTPFDIPLMLFGVVLLLSSVVAINKVDSIISVIPALFAIILFFFTINLAKNRPAYNFLLTACISGVLLTTIITVLSYAKIYILPLPFTKIPTFNTIGNQIDLMVYLLCVVPLIGFSLYQLITRFMGKTFLPKVHIALGTESPAGMGLTIVSAVFMVLALIVTGLQMVQTKPILLPFDTAFQTAFAAISQDTGRTIQGFLFGSGYGTYVTDFTRFKNVAFNANPTLWSLTFFRSASFVLELLATAGILGLLSYGLILFTIFRSIRNTSKKVITHPIAISLGLVAITSILLPFSPILVILFFIILGFYASEKRLEGKSEEYEDVELRFVALTEGLIQATSGEEIGRVKTDYTKILPVSLFILYTVIVAVVGFFTYNFTLSDIIFQRSLVAASQNNGLQTYTDQVTAIRTFPYRDAYYRIASQTDLALANSLASSIPAGSSPSAQIQQNVTQLIQEAISTARTATQLSEATAVNWQNLSAIYRGLIGFGQNAEQFAIATQQQAIALNPNDPQGYINLGGIYYQTANWEAAQQAFQTAASLKPDYPNAYYNLGHALENKGDTQNALIAYQTVQQLVSGDKQATEKITGEIDELKRKIQNQADQQAKSAQENAQSQATSQTQESALQTNKPATQLPEQKKQVKIPEPKVTLTPSVAPDAATPAPSQAVTPSPAE